MTDVIGWKLYYGDGSVVSSKESDWAVAPSDDVQVLSVYFDRAYKIWRDGEEHEEHFRDMHFGKDYYWQFGNGQAAQVPQEANVKLGRELPQTEWRALYNRALQDTRF